MSEGNLFEQQEKNRRRSALLIAGFVLFFAWVGFGGDLSWYLATKDLPPGQYHHIIPWAGLITSAVAGTVAWHSWRFGAERVLKATNARELVEPRSPEEQRFANIVEEMAIASGQPRPRMWIIPEEDPNAFATGKGPGTSHIAVTSGLLSRLDRDELQGVIGHEMAHIRNLDVRLMTLLAAMVGVVAMLSDVLSRGMRYGFRGRGGNKKGNPLAIVVLVLWLISILLAPLITRLLSMAVSRKREYLADATGAQFTRNPEGLARALEKIDAASSATKAITRGVGHMCIVDPGERRLSERPGRLGDIFASHPPIGERVARLRTMAYGG
ncbi:MAG TPA: M48 family metallopeptidase [Gemmatimonadales bacterium]|nr:M48 family metallopeptidase [Gemmatimonadales bacterium]